MEGEHSCRGCAKSEAKTSEGMSGEVAPPLRASQCCCARKSGRGRGFKAMPGRGRTQGEVASAGRGGSQTGTEVCREPIDV